MRKLCLRRARVLGSAGVLGPLQSAGLGEGWSDFYALSLLSQTADDMNGNYPLSGYVTHQYSGLTENYYYGIRRYPYTTVMTRNPLTFEDIDATQTPIGNPHPGVPISPNLGTRISPNPAEFHNIGEVWCVTLWEARAKLIGRYGQAGNQIMLQLVTDGMNLCPPNPNFIQARDAFFDAVLVSNYCADNWADLWEAFSKRGMGRFASAPASITTDGVVESFDGGPPSPCQTE